MFATLAITLNEYNLPYPPPITSPIHPIVVHFVIAMVIFSVLFDVLGHLRRQPSFLNVGWWNLVTATAAIIFAVFFGQLEAGLANVTNGAEPVLSQHTIIGWSLSALFVALAVWRGVLRNRDPNKLNPPYLGAGLVVVSLVFYQVFLGHQLVWMYGLHVKPVVEASRNGGCTLNDVVNPTVAQDLGLPLGINDLPYLLPIHPAFVHFTIGLFVVAILFDGLGTLYTVRKRLGLNLPLGRSTLYDIGWWNIVGSAGFTIFTVIFGYFEIALANPPVGERSPWGLTASQTMLAHGVGGLILLGVIVGLAVWRGFQRYVWRRNESRQVQWGYLFAGALTIGLLFIQGELGGHMATDFGIHNTAVEILREPPGSPARACRIETNCKE